MGAVVAAIWHRLREYLNWGEARTDKPKKKQIEEPNIVWSGKKQKYNIFVPASASCNSNAFDASERSRQVLENVMESLADPNTHLIGVYGFYDDIKDTLLQRVNRRIQRDNLFDMVLTASLTKRPDVKKIQEEIARQLGLTFNHKSKDKRAKELIDRIKNVHKILIVLEDLHKGLDLGKIGIPYGADHIGCKILITSIAEDVLSNHMHTQKNFMV